MNQQQSSSSQRSSVSEWIGRLVIVAFAFVGLLGLIAVVVVVFDIGGMQSNFVGFIERLQPTATPTPAPIPSPVVTLTSTSFPTATATAIPTITPSPTPTFTPTASPTPTIPAYVTVLTLVQRQANLETTRFYFEKVVPVEDAQHMFGVAGERLLYVGVGYVGAGVSLAGLSADSVRVDENKNLTLNLPPAHLTNCVLDPQKSYIYEQSSGVVRFLWNALYEERNLLEEAEQAAIIAFRDTALENGILIEARVDAEWYLRTLLMSAGFNSVTFVTPEGINPQHDPGCLP